jgi:adenine C2-methylase RlmN of 23S rRNA A2503 and tRNA A37
VAETPVADLHHALSLSKKKRNELEQSKAVTAIEQIRSKISSDGVSKIL